MDEASAPLPRSELRFVVRDADAVMAAARTLLLQREGLNQNLLATILASRSDGDHVLATVETERDDVAGVVGRRGSWSQLSAGAGPEVGASVGAWLAERDEPIRSVESDPRTASGVAEGYRTVAGRGMTAALSLRVMECTDLQALLPRPQGVARRAAEPDLPLLEDWYVAFDLEANHGVSDPDALRAGIRRRVLDPQPRPRILVWDVDGRATSFVIAGGQTPTGEVIHAVYTPPELRGRGYGGAVVADETAQILARGVERVFLQADAANPISNALYRKIGYRDVGITERWDVDAS